MANRSISGFSINFTAPADPKGGHLGLAAAAGPPGLLRPSPGVVPGREAEP